jgi:hypothetical protein
MAAFLALQSENETHGVAPLRGICQQKSLFDKKRLLQTNATSVFLSFLHGDQNLWPQYKRELAPNGPLSALRRLLWRRRAQPSATLDKNEYSVFGPSIINRYGRLSTLNIDEMLGGVTGFFGTFGVTRASRPRRTAYQTNGSGTVETTVSLRCQKNGPTLPGRACQAGRGSNSIAAQLAGRAKPLFLTQKRGNVMVAAKM